MHMCWNLSDFVHITTHNDDYGVIQYIIKVKTYLTGGAYGNTSSLIAIVLFVIAIILVAMKSVQRINLRD